MKLPEKNGNFSEISLENRNILRNCLKNRNSSEIYLEKSKFLLKLPEKNRNFSKICPEKSIFFCKIA